eukprot:TRINITY_DN8046_c0_g1_i2.p1 TRINITY_DN8046_c0_g1~~TRINITY_DN8046_c0_g1_i2.p1  ORF type:complete len:726 (+),score=139.82 TRINITY_DN8046_c0_g1_i2:71-2248(+)
MEGLVPNEKKVRKEKEPPLNEEEKAKLREEYIARTIPGGKGVLCYLAMRGSCIFPPEVCKFAHSVAELQLELLPFSDEDSGEEKDLQKGAPILVIKKNLDDDDIPQGDKNELINEQRYSRKVQKKLCPDIQYPLLFSYQAKLLKEGRHPAGREYSLVELNTIPKTRMAVRELLHKDIAREFFLRLASILDWKQMKRRFIEKQFSKCHVSFKQDYLLEDMFAFPTNVVFPGEDKKIPYIFPFPPTNKLELDVMQRAAKIYIDSIEADTPFNVRSFIRKYHDIGILNEPPLHMLAMAKGIMKFDDYFNVMIQDSTFISLVQAEAQQRGVTIGESISLRSADSIPPEKVQSLLNSLVVKMTEEVAVHCAKQNHLRLKCLDESRVSTSLKHIIQGSQLKTFLLDEGRLNSFLNRFYKSQGFITVQVGSNTFLLTELGPYSNENGIANGVSKDLPERFSERLKNVAQVDSRFVLVDNFAEISAAWFHLKSAECLGVDLEGHLSMGGLLELVQISNGKTVFVFDIYKMKHINDLEVPENKELYDFASEVIKTLFTDTTRKIVFHHGVNDRTALYFHFGIEEMRTFDTSGVYIFNQIMKQKLAQKRETFQLAPSDLAERQIVQKEYVQSPGLNLVLKHYNATHGENDLKEIIYSRFGDPNWWKYFTSRPIQPDYFKYAARDAEDLIEVSYKMQDELLPLLAKLFPEVSLEPKDIEELLIIISNTFNLSLIHI